MINQVKGQNVKILLAGFAGITAGIIAGLLMAPEAGKSTRQQFAKSATDLSAYFRQTLNKGANSKGKKGNKKKKKSD